MREILLRKMNICRKLFLIEPTLLHAPDKIRIDQIQSILNKPYDELNNGEYLCLCLYYIVDRCLTECIDLSDMYIFDIPTFRENNYTDNYISTICLEDDVDDRYVNIQISMSHKLKKACVRSFNEDIGCKYKSIKEGIITWIVN